MANHTDEHGRSAFAKSKVAQRMRVIGRSRSGKAKNPYQNKSYTRAYTDIKKGRGLVRKFKA